MSKSYWGNRVADAQNAITDKSIDDVNRQMRIYYATTMNDAIAEFEATYDKLQATVEAGREPTPADLYKLDKYWQLQAKMSQELEKLGDKEIRLLSKKFEAQFFEVYNAWAIEGQPAFNTLSTQGVRQMINSIWVADGKSWSERIWTNTRDLLSVLNDEMVKCVVNGKGTSELRKQLMHQFNVSYNRADALVRTEMAHIQTQAARERYRSYGIEEVEVLADPDDRTCPVCAALDKKRYPVNAVMPVPAHPRCRCTIVPVIKSRLS